MRFLLLSLFLVSCNFVPEAKVDIKNLSSKKDNCDNSESNGLVKSQMISSSIIKINCSKIDDYMCDIRQFSPELSDAKNLNQEFCTGSGCLNYNHFIFNNSDMSAIDEFSTAEDFASGGQYNYQETRCWHKSNNSIEGNSEDLRDAIDRAIASCESKVDKL